MKETQFIKQNCQKWERLERLLLDKTLRKDPEALQDLFIQITDDLSYARTFYPNRSVRVYLNGLAQRLLHLVYRGRGLKLRNFGRLWSETLPRAMWDARRPMLLSLFIFIVSFGIGVISSVIEPEFLGMIVGSDYVSMTESNIEKGDPMAVYKESRPMGMTLGIAFNNLFVAFRTAILGVLGSIGTLFILIYNGIMVGAFQYFFIARGLGVESALTIWIHGTLEISAIIISGGAGLLAGSGLLFPGTYSRPKAFQRTVRQSLTIFLGIVPVLILAAIFEGFLTRFTQTPAPIRFMFIAVSLLFVLWYFVWLPWRKGGADDSILSEERELPAEFLKPIDFGKIKSASEILSDAFGIMYRQWYLLAPAALTLALVFAFLAFFLSDNPPHETFVINGSLLGVMSEALNLFTNYRVEGLAWISLVILALLGAISLSAVDAEWEQRYLLNKDLLIRSLLAATPFLGFIAIFWIVENPVWQFGLAAVSFPFFTMMMAIIRFTQSNPLAAFGLAAGLIRVGDMVSLGLSGALPVLMFFLFLDTGIWDMFVRFFAWMQPGAADAQQSFYTIVTIGISALFLCIWVILNCIAGALLYFSQYERFYCANLREEAEAIGTQRRIRGIPRE
ncbi:MAG: stage II sporulation protein M [Saprospiraceae bacterium]